ncbi:transposase [Aromatoleum anaerobium]|uniref:Transposase n=1 Tax=Aromatoleum anaerobium TaxID=182180 RepID=A0ABX1PMK5_9RHOO|nr:transposase [Aromatoleum anaerobium]MCK0507990.1 hypothetical protein [Aromatoleum anaerobium]
MLSRALSPPVMARRGQCQPDKAGDAEFVVCDQTIENRLHWVLDVSFGEDASTLCKDNAPQNLSLRKHPAKSSAMERRD